MISAVRINRVANIRSFKQNTKNISDRTKFKKFTTDNSTDRSHSGFDTKEPDAQREEEFSNFANSNKPRKMTADSKSIIQEIDKPNECKDLYMLMEQSKRNLEFIKSQFRIVSNKFDESYKHDSNTFTNRNVDTSYSKSQSPFSNLRPTKSVPK